MALEDRKKWNSVATSSGIELDRTQIKENGPYVQVKRMLNTYYKIAGKLEIGH
jgi:hypothetical protein